MYNQILFGAKFVHNAHVLILSLKCVLMCSIDEDCMIFE